MKKLLTLLVIVFLSTVVSSTTELQPLEETFEIEPIAEEQITIEQPQEPTLQEQSKEENEITGDFIHKEKQLTLKDFSIDATNDFFSLFRSLVGQIPLDEELTENTFKLTKNKLTEKNANRNGRKYYLITYNPNNIATAQQIIQNTLLVEGYVPENKYIVYSSLEEIQTLVNEELVLAYEEYNTLERILGNEDYSAKTDFFISLFPSADEKALAKALEGLGGEVYGVHDSVLQVEIDASFLEEIVPLQGVLAIEPRPEMKLFNDKTNIVSGISGTTGIRAKLGLYGKGEIIAITDGGLDTGKNDVSMHDDIKGRILSLTDVWDTRFCCSDKNVDYDSHGTHVTGIALGNGNKSGSDPSNSNYAKSFAGSAPQAKLIFQAAGGNKGVNFEPKFPKSTYLFQPAYNSKARIHSNSWGVTGADGLYSSGSKDLDDFTWKNKDYTILFAAGNGKGNGTVVIPSTAKNSISVSGIWRDDINKHVYAEGPTADGRFKPDIVAPALGYAGQTSGTGIISTKSSVQLPYPMGCKGGPGGNLNTYYCESSGTSMATPHVAGAAALTREYYITHKNHKTPSAALIKATLLNGAEQVNGQPTPNYQNGFGRLNMAKALPAQTNQLTFVDETTGLTTNKKNTYYYFASKSKPFSLTLVWTDHPAIDITLANQKLPKLVNDLNLVITDPNGNKYNGNDIIAPRDNQVDHLNNVEQVRIQNPIEGTYTVEITGKNIPKGPQDYAFVLTYDNIPTLNAGITLQGTPKLGNTITFTITDPSLQGKDYLLLMSASGTKPGLPLGDGRTLPIAIDIITNIMFNPLNWNPLGFTPLIGKLDNTGKGIVTWNIPKQYFLTNIPFTVGCATFDNSQTYPISIKTICQNPVQFKISA